MNGKGDKWRGGWTPQYADNFDKIFQKEKEKMKDELTKEQKQELEKLQNEITEEAKKVVQDFKDNPSEDSGSVTVVHEKSPLIMEKDERLMDFGGKQWKLKTNKDESK